MKSLTMLHVRGETATKIGYGRMGVKLAAALERAGVDLYNGLDTPDGDRQHDLPNTRIGTTNAVMWVSTPGHARGWHTGQHTVLSSMWESCRLPEAYREHLHAFDQVIVPSQQNLELFGQYHPNVALAPLGVDPSEWSYVPRRPPENEFRFLIGGTGARKGTDLAVKAFRRVFATWPKDMPVPKLVLKNPKGEDFYGDRIEMVTGYMPDADEQGLYATAHCYLQPSRGEGFGLQPLQALAQGCPTILTAAHGHDTFAHLGYGLSTTFSEAAYFIFGNAGQWWEPDFDELCEYMEYVYFHYDEAEAKAKESAAVVANTLTWDHCAQRYIDILGDQLTEPYGGDGSWFRPEQKLYPVVVSKPWRADIAGATLVFEPGVTYYETSDSKRILFEAGILDPICIETDGEDSGLLPQEVARLGAYSARHAFCDHCGQKMGTGVTRADELMAAAQ